MPNVLLNLDTLIDRPKIRIDGDLHEIVSPDELDVITSHLLAAQGRRMEELMKAGELSDDDKEELRSIIAQLSNAIMAPVPVPVRAKLSDSQRLSVIESFTALLLSKKAGTAAALFAGLIPSPPAPPTGAKPPRGSSASTAAGRTGGSGKRRSRS